MSGFPPKLKPFKKYLVQANRLQKVAPLIAYYCRMHAVMGMLKIPKSDRDSTVLEFLGSLMEKLEADRQNVELDAENDAERVRNFALNVFVSADNDDQRGSVTVQTSHAFMTAYVILDCLHQFGELDSNIENKLKYASWRAVEIKKAMDAGRNPDPPPRRSSVVSEQGESDDELDTFERELKDFGEQEEEEEESEEDDSMEDRHRPNRRGSPRLPTPPRRKEPKRRHRNRGKNGGRGNNQTQREQLKRINELNEAEDMTREGLSSIRFNDISTAKDRLERALDILHRI